MDALTAPPTATVDASVSVSVVFSDGACLSASLPGRTLDKRSRLARGGKLLAMCWAAALGSLFIPGFHFVLVPSFLLAGPVLFAIGYGQKRLLLGGTVVCPGCASENSVKPQSASWPLLLVCQGCNGGLELSPG